MKEDSDLLTVSDRVQLLVNALNEGDHYPVVKLFTPDAAATRLISEVDPDDPDRLFGLCDLGLGYPELGYVSLTELAAAKGKLRLPVERDLHLLKINRYRLMRRRHAPMVGLLPNLTSSGGAVTAHFPT